MRAATVKELKTDLLNYSQADLVKICLRLSKFKKENKELLTYLLYEAADEQGYIVSVKQEIDTQFDQLNRKSPYWMKKGIRKTQKLAKKYIRYSQNKETEVEILLYFCQKLKDLNPSMSRSKVLKNLYDRQIDYIERVLQKLHEDLQYDYQVEIDKLRAS